MRLFNKFLPLVFVAILIISSSCKKEDNSQEIINYTNFKITSIKITSMSFLDQNNAGWDPFDGPDVFYSITDGTTTLLNGTNSKINDVLSSNLPLTWNLTVAHQITNISVTQYINIIDYDTLDPNDSIGSIGFKIDEHKSGYPKTITKSNGSLTITITGEWY
jgi:hypothetical protein